MKLNHLFAIMAIAGSVCVACSKDDPKEPEKEKEKDPQEEKADYGKLYLSQAKDSPIEATLDKTDAATTVIATAYVEKAAKEDISVEFEINNSLVASFNSSNAKSHLELPSSAYTLAKANLTIKNGTFHAEDASVTVNPAELEGGKSYLLPLSIKKSSYDKVDETKATVYYVFNITEKDPDVKLTEVYDFGKKVNGEMFCAGTSFILNDYDRNCDLILYTRGDDRKYTEKEGSVGQGWKTAEGVPFDCLGFISPNTVTFRLGDTFQEFGFAGAFETGHSWGPGAFIGTAGWAPFKWIFQFKELTWLTVTQEGALLRYDVQKCDDYETSHWVIINTAGCGIQVAAEGFASYEKYFCCGNYIFALDADGKLFAWPFSDSFEIGDRFEMPESWKFQQIVGCEENHFLCLAESGKLYEAQLKLFSE